VKKKIIIIASVILIVAIGAGVFVWLSSQPKYMEGTNIRIDGVYQERRTSISNTAVGYIRFYESGRADYISGDSKMTAEDAYRELNSGYNKNMMKSTFFQHSSGVSVAADGSTTQLPELTIVFQRGIYPITYEGSMKNDILYFDVHSTYNDSSYKQVYEFVKVK